MANTLTEIKATWKGDKVFIGENSTGGLIQMGTLDKKPGVGPMQLLLMGLAGCTGIDIVDLLEKKRTPASAMEIKVIGKRAPDYPMIWTEIHVIYQLWGENISPKDVEHFIKLSEEKYCSVGIMLGKSARITSEFEILNSRETFD